MTTKRWQRNLWATWAAEFLALMGFSATAPLWAYYIQDLGVHGDAVARWNGLIVSAPAFTMAVMGPIWGMLSDRYGRKLMVMRAMFGGSVLLALMGFARTVEQVFILRLLQGVLTGTVAAATTLVASTTPRERLGETLGKLQLAIFLGQFVGPSLGGFISDMFGYRPTFWMTGAYLLLAGFLMLFLVQEDFTPVKREKQSGSLIRRVRMEMSALFVGSMLGLVLGLRFALRLGLQISTPMLPLVVQRMLPESTFLGSAAGLLTTVSGLFSAIAAPIMGRWGDSHGGRTPLLITTFMLAIAIGIQAIAPAYWVLLITQIFIGLAVGGTLSIISAYIGRCAPQGKAGTAYGLDSMAVSLSNAIGPTIGGWVGAISLTMPFYVGCVVTAVSGFAVLKLPKERSAISLQPSARI
ncbi:MAG TPA: MFS transporter [Anaerolineae bacterium]|nr:MFS transporter [Anaerolineae bacterium]HQK12406.1 MFS transporter [Anaerolineae bacterium]